MLESEDAMSESVAVHRRRPQRWPAIAGFGVGLLIAAPITRVGALGVSHELALRNEGREVEADVLDRRFMAASGGESYEVRYCFHVGGDPSLYSASDELSRRDLWRTVSHEAWSAARSSAKVRVVYLPSDPWVNRPANPGGAPLGDPMAGLVVFGLVFGVCACGLAALALRMRREARDWLAVPALFCGPAPPAEGAAGD
jgi:hypothetical protein